MDLSFDYMLVKEHDSINKSVIFIYNRFNIIKTASIFLQEVFTYQWYPRATILVIEGITSIIMVVVHGAHHLSVVTLAHSQLGVVAEMTAEISARSSMD